jgi:hypothetical protein
MTISGVSSNLSPVIQSVLNIRNQLDDLQRQIGTSEKADTFAGLGPQSGMAIGLSAQLAAIGSFDETITTVGTRISIGQTDLTQLASVARSVKAATLSPNFDIDTSGQTTTQKTVLDQLDQMLSLLNTQAGDRYIFSGTATNQPAVETTDHILKGNGAQAGLKQLIAERNQADLGANGLGRLLIPSTGATLVGSGAALGPDVAAVGTGTVNTLQATASLASLGVAAGDVLNITDGTNTVSYTVGATDTVSQLIAGLSGGSVNATVSLSGSPGHLVVTAPNNNEELTLTATAPGDLTAVGFAPGNQTFAPTNPAIAGMAGTLTITVGSYARKRIHGCRYVRQEHRPKLAIVQKRRVEFGSALVPVVTGRLQLGGGSQEEGGLEFTLICGLVRNLAIRFRRMSHCQGGPSRKPSAFLLP